MDHNGCGIGKPCYVPRGPPESRLAVGTGGSQARPSYHVSVLRMQSGLGVGRLTMLQPPGPQVSVAIVVLQVPILITAEEQHGGHEHANKLGSQRHQNLAVERRLADAPPIRRKAPPPPAAALPLSCISFISFISSRGLDLHVLASVLPPAVTISPAGHLGTGTDDVVKTATTSHGVLGGVLETTSFQSAMKFPNTTILATIVASFLLASWLGCCIVSSPWSDRVGRRQWIMAGALVQIIGTIISVSSYSYEQLIAGRVVIGIGNGFVVASTPAYIAEITPATKMRGPLVGVLMGFACTGTAIAYWVDFGFTYASGQVVWCLPVAIQILWSLLTLVLLIPNADSPRWYFLRGREEDGDAVLRQIYPDEETAQQVRREILAELRQDRGEPLKFSNIFKDKSNTQAVRRIRDGVVLVGVAYLMGINMIFYYMTTIFQVYIGLPGNIASICSGSTMTLLAIGVFFGSFFCQERRKWLLWGAAAQSVFIIAFTILLAFGTKKTSSAAAAALFGWILVFSPTWAPLPYIYVSETMPLRHRHTGVGLSISSQRLMAFLTVYAGPIAIASIGWKTWIWFAVFNVIGFPYVYFFIFETKDKSLETMNELFGEKLDISSSDSSDIDLPEPDKAPAATTAQETAAVA
ncbi:hypothetical protein VTN77DRAFT_6228 [Rasamsonia byssochlamydoides]|uniref:uncharacterized protein n=1 Tax=Rasamsonia byssochlamydoides TaxID=89139 RepID=UPI0037436A0B